MKVRPGRTPRLAWLAVAALLAAGCSPGATGAAARPSPGGGVSDSRTVPGGCGGTRVVVGTTPPAWAAAGFRAGGLDRIHWAMGSPPNAVAYIFAGQLVSAGERPDGSSNKILWVTRDPPSGMTIVGRPVGRSEPAVSVSGEIVAGNQLPSIVDVPAAGCWSFEVAWIHGKRQVSTIDLDVLPAGTQPVYT